MKISKHLVSWISVLLVLMNYSEVRAGHLLGGNLTYTCVGQDSFMVRLVYFRDCQGVPAGLSQTVKATSPTCGTILSLTLYPISGTGVDLTPLCPGWPSPCVISPSTLPIGIEEYIYEALFVIPTNPSPPNPCTDWVLSFEQCCRGDVHTNISYFLSTPINNNVQPCNNSPVMLNDPIPTICAGQPFYLNFGAYDPDGDSLSYALVPCMQSATLAIPYTPPLTYSRPLLTTAPMKLNPITGTLSFTPSQSQIGTICMQVSEFRNGVKIGSVVHDFTMAVIACNNPPPVASGINGSVSSYDTTVCAGQPVSFYILASDPNPFQNVNMTWNGGLPGASFSYDPIKDSAIFSWTTPANGHGNYFLNVMVQDDGCPIVSSNFFTYTIHILDIELGPNHIICQGDSVQINPLNANLFTTFSWLPTTGVSNPNIANPYLFPMVTTTYTLTATNGSCISTDKVMIKVLKKKQLFAPPQVETCADKPIDLMEFPEIISWLPEGSQMKQLSELPIQLDQGPGKIIPIVVKDKTGCTLPMPFNVLLRKAPVGGIAILNATELPDGSAIELGSINSHNRYQWTNSKGEVLSINSRYRVVGSADDKYYLSYWDEAGCKGLDSFSVTTSAVKVVLPNVFKPSSDIEANKTFRILAIEGIELEFLRVYGTNSEILFETRTNDTESGWDGSVGGQLAEAGTYVYEIKGKNTLNNSEYIKRGNVRLIR